MTFGRPILAIFGIALCIGLGLVFANIIEKNRERKASEALFSTRSQINKINVELDKAQRETNVDNKKTNSHEKNQNHKKEESKAKKYSQAEFNEKLAPLVREYESIISAHLSTSAAAHAALFLSGLYGKYNFWKKANEILLKVVSAFEEEHFFYGLIHTRIGNNLMEMGDFNEALTSYNKILPLPHHRHLHGYILLKKGLSHEQLKQVDEAQKSYQQALQDHKDSPPGKTAKNYLRYMEFKKTYRQL